MANKRQWRRYQPPAEQRNERGESVVVASRQPAKPKPTSKRVIPPKAPAAPNPQPKSGWIGLAAMAVILAVIIGIVAAVRGGNDDSPDPDLDTTLLTEDFIGSTLAAALEEEGNNAVLVHLDEYRMSVEYFDPNTRRTRTIEANDYTDGFTLRVRESFYEDYQPRPFDLSVIDASAMIAAVEEAATKTDDVHRFQLRIEADRESGEVEMVVRVTGDEDVEITTAP